MRHGNDTEELRRDALRRLYDEIAGYPDEREVDARFRPSDAVILSEAFPELESLLDRYTDEIRDDYVASLDDWYEDYTQDINIAFSDANTAGKRLDQDGIWYKSDYVHHHIMEIVEERGGAYTLFPSYIDRYEEEIAAAENTKDLEERIEGSRDHWTAHRSETYGDWYDNLWNALHVGNPSGRDRIRSHHPGEEKQAVMGALQAKTVERLRGTMQEQEDPDRRRERFGS